MKLEESIKILENYGKWRRGADIPMVNSKSLTEAIDVVVNNYKEMRRTLNE